MSKPTSTQSDSQESLACQVVRAIQELDDRGLVHASQWFVNLLIVIPVYSSISAFLTDTNRTFRLCEYLQILPSEGIDSLEPEISNVSVENAIFTFAKSQFDLKEYRRCSHTLRGVKSAKASFLRLYSLFLVRKSHFKFNFCSCRLDTNTPSRLVRRGVKKRFRYSIVSLNL